MPDPIRDDAPYPPLQDRREPTLLQKRPGRWTARYRYAGETKDVGLGLTTDAVDAGEDPPKAVTDRFRKHFVLPYLRGEYSPWQPNGPKRGPTMLEAKDLFLARHTDSPSTHRAYESVLRLFERSLDPHTLVAEVRPSDVRAYVYRKQSKRKGSAKTISRATQKHAWAHLRAFFNWAIREGMIADNPAERIDGPRVEQRQAPFLMPAELAALLDASSRIEPAYFGRCHAVAFGAGLRRAELCTLQVQDVNLDLGFIHIRSKTADRDGVDFRPKGRRDRRVRIQPLAERALVEAVEAAAPHGRTGFLFSDDGRTTIDPGRITKTLHEATEAAEIRDRITPHSARGHYITYLLLLDWPVPLVQLLAGHADSSTTLGYWRDASMLLHGGARERFRAEATRLGFEPYSAGVEERADGR